jgi:cytochrome b
MRNQKVYDLPVRVFHWVFAGLFATAFIVAKTVDDESYVFSYHMMAGMLLTSTVVMRIVWGFWGTRHSRFAAFALNPKDLFSYFKGILSGDKRKWAGHNPASSWAALAMFALVLALGTTGYLMASGGEETFEDVHEVFAVAFLVIAAGHVAGVALHTFRHRDAIGIHHELTPGDRHGVCDSGRGLCRLFGQQFRSGNTHSPRLRNELATRRERRASQP